MHLALFKAFFEDGLNLANTNILVEIGQEVGLDVPRLAGALQRDEHGSKVLADGLDAHANGVASVPTLWAQAHGTTRLVVAAHTFESLIVSLQEIETTERDALELAGRKVD